MLQCSPGRGDSGQIDELLGNVEFRGEETEQRVLDAGAIVPALLTGRIAIEGNRREGVYVQLTVERTGAAARFGTTTGPDGTFELRGLPGAWTVAAAIDTGQVHGWKQYRWPERLQLAPGERRVSDFAFARAGLMLRCLAPGGEPVARMQVQVRTPDGHIRAVTPHTDGDGRTRVDVDPGNYDLFVLPRNLQEPAALQAWFAARPGKALADALLPVGSFAVAMGTGEQELRLPASWVQ
jgi:hypothetical protein